MKKEQIKIEEKFIIKGNLDKILTEIKDSINLFLDNIIGIIKGYFFRFIAVNSNNTQTEYKSNIIKNESISNIKKISNNLLLMEGNNQLFLYSTKNSKYLSCPLF